VRRILILLIAAIVFGGCSASEKAEKEERPAAKDEASERAKDTVTVDAATQKSIGLRVETAKMAQVANTILVTAVVKPNETRVAHLKPLSRGRVTQLNVRAGDRIRAGQALVVYDNVEAGELAGEYRSALAARNKASAETEVTKSSLDRAERLVASGAIAKAEVERRSAEYKNAQAAVEVAQADIDRIGEKLGRFGITISDLEKSISSTGASGSLAQIVLRAPFDGVITAANVAEGEVIETAQDLLTLTDISMVWVLGDLYERDLGKVRVGQQADVLTEAYPNETFHGRVTYVSDVIDAQSRTAKVRCEVPNSKDRLKLDMFAQIRLQSSGTRSALVIPESAVQVIDGKDFVFVRTTESTFARKEVTLGTKTGKMIEVNNGLADGDIVAGEGSFALKSALLKDRIGGDEH
jgi:cobalt-zinc-cadmium efflux system membrane fusion protein